MEGEDNKLQKMEKIRIGISGYGNLGKGVELAAAQNPDIELVAIFTRREPEHASTGSALVHISELRKYTDRIDVLILCGGSVADLPLQGLNCRGCSTLSTASTLMQKFPNISGRWMNHPGRQES